MAFKDRKNRGLLLSDRRAVLAGGLDPIRSPYLFEDFMGLGATLADNPNVTINQHLTEVVTAVVSATAGAPTAGHLGWVTGTTDNLDNVTDEVALGQKPWLVPAGLASSMSGGLIVAECGFVIPSALTARRYFIGVTDDETEGAGDGPIAIASGTTITAVADDAAGFIFSSQATDADGYYTGAVKATSVGTALNVSTSSEGATVGPGVVDDYTKLRVEIDVLGSVYYYGIVSAAGGRSEVPQFCDFQNAAITASVPLIPIFVASTTTTTSVEWDVDYLFGGICL